MGKKFQPGEVLNDRYELVRILGEGALGRTMLAKDNKRSDKLVAVKELLPSRMKRWKDYDLFHRECATLRNLDHPGVPTYLDDFEISSEEDEVPARLVLVQQFVDGQSLQDEIDGGATFDEERTIQIVTEVLQILKYLHGLNPPVIHRDLKPANIMQTSDGQIVVIDFGAVREAVTADGIGSTIVGTMGYMPPEQYAGASSPATDIFSLGATAVQLVSGHDPVELFEGIHQFKIPEDLPVTIGFERVLLQMTEPDVERRYQSATAVLADLDHRFLMVPKESITSAVPVPFEIRPAPRPFPGFQLRDPETGMSHTSVVLLSIFAVTLSFVFPVTAISAGNWAFAASILFPFIASYFALRMSARSRDRIQIYREGVYTLGEVTGRFLSSTASDKVNLTYRYSVGDRFRHGSVSTSDKAYGKLSEGDPIGVIYRPSSTSEHVLYAVGERLATEEKADRRKLLSAE